MTSLPKGYHEKNALIIIYYACVLIQLPSTKIRMGAGSASFFAER